MSNAQKRPDLAPETRRAAQARQSREAILEATMRCLVQYGYAETSTNRVVEAAGISRGALTHHFATKASLIVATTNWVMHSALTWFDARTEKADPTVESELRVLWGRLMDTPQMLALLEILIATRTDKDLERRIKPDLIAWNDSISRLAARRMQSADGDAERFVRLWTIARIFFRGLLTHAAFARTDQEIRDIADEFIALLTPRIEPRG